jgi:hypothetical protein
MNIFLEQTLVARARLSGRQVIQGTVSKGLRSFFQGTRIPKTSKPASKLAHRKIGFQWPIRWEPVPVMQPIDGLAMGPLLTRIPRWQFPFYFAESQNESQGSKDRSDVLGRIIEELKLTTRSYNVLRTLGAKTIRDVTNLTEQQILATKNAGKGTLNDIKAALADFNLSLSSQPKLARQDKSAQPTKSDAQLSDRPNWNTLLAQSRVETRQAVHTLADINPLYDYFNNLTRRPTDEDEDSILATLEQQLQHPDWRVGQHALETLLKLGGGKCLDVITRAFPNLGWQNQDKVINTLAQRPSRDVERVFRLWQVVVEGARVQHPRRTLSEALHSVQWNMPSINRESFQNELELISRNYPTMVSRNSRPGVESMLTSAWLTYLTSPEAAQMNVPIEVVMRDFLKRYIQPVVEPLGLYAYWDILPLERAQEVHIRVFNIKEHRTVDTLDGPIQVYVLGSLNAATGDIGHTPRRYGNEDVRQTHPHVLQARHPMGHLIRQLPGEDEVLVFEEDFSRLNQDMTLVDAHTREFRQMNDGVESLTLPRRLMLEAASIHFAGKWEEFRENEIWDALKVTYMDQEVERVRRQRTNLGVDTADTSDDVMEPALLKVIQGDYPYYGLALLLADLTRNRPYAAKTLARLSGYEQDQTREILSWAEDHIKARDEQSLRMEAAYAYSVLEQENSRLTVALIAAIRDQLAEWFISNGWPTAARGARIVLGIISAAVESFITPIPVLLPAWVAAHRKSDRAFARQSIPAFLAATVLGIAAGLSIIHVFPSMDSRFVVGVTVYLFHFLPHAGFSTKQELPTAPLFARAA